MKFFRWLPAFLICSFIFSQPSLTGTQSTGLSLTITEWFAHISFLLKKKHFIFLLEKQHISVNTLHLDGLSSMV